MKICTLWHVSICPGGRSPPDFLHRSIRFSRCRGMSPPPRRLGGEAPRSSLFILRARPSRRKDYLRLHGFSTNQARGGGGAGAWREGEVVMSARPPSRPGRRCPQRLLFAVAFSERRFREHGDPRSAGTRLPRPLLRMLLCGGRNPCKKGKQGGTAPSARNSIHGLPAAMDP